VIHAIRRSADHLSNFFVGQQSFLVQPLVTALHVIITAEAIDHPEGKRKSASRTPVALVELPCNLLFGMGVEQTVDLCNDFRLGLLQHPGGLGEWNVQFPRRAAPETQLHQSLAGFLLAAQGHVLQE